MEVSPLAQQARPSSFQPKIIGLYDDIFKQDDEDLVYSDGFWGEFFLLRPDKAGLERRLDRLTTNDLLHLQHETQQLFVRAVSQVKGGRAPSDENALDTLTVFLGIILTKRYTNPSADIITLLAGLDEVDAVFFDFANAIESIIRTGRSAEVRSKAINVALSLTSGAYQTSLVSYFAHRDLFPALMKSIQDSDGSELVFKPFLLLGLLANYNKFEFRNPYRLRLEDFVNESAIQKIAQGIGSACSQFRNSYVTVQEDVAEGWTVGSTLAYIGLGVLAPSKAAAPTRLNAEELKEGFAILPSHGAAVLLGVYDFTNANKIFRSNLVTCTSTSKTVEAPFGAFLSYTSYLVHHAYRSLRATTYALLNFLILRIIIEDLALCKILCDPENLLAVRLCRQRQPFLPPTPKPRPAAAPILDILVDTINHNLRRHLDIPLYISCIGLIHRLLSYLAFTRTRLTYHWPLLWQTLLSFLRFLTTYAPSLTVQDPDLRLLINPFLATLALAVTSGESFLPDPAAYDDLFYKLVEAGDYLSRFQKVFHMHLMLPSESLNATSNGATTAPIDVLIQIAAHYHDLVEAEKGKGRMGNNMSPREVSKVVRQGYDSLSLPATEGLDRWDRFREGDERSMLKRVARVGVEDTKKLLRAS
ncbi:MAG: hypothetical protein ASARMPREDX12_002058 [Alectoria sarmentosa]|nr:MAG: hypothetical protein ASARMPREDX12_002058 [Alectoria sarmentosa]